MTNIASTLGKKLIEEFNPSIKFSKPINTYYFEYKISTKELSALRKFLGTKGIDGLGELSTIDC